MSTIRELQQETAANGFRSVRLGAPALLILVGISLGVGYGLHLAGFAGWLTLALAGASTAGMITMAWLGRRRRQTETAD